MPLHDRREFVLGLGAAAIAAGLTSHGLAQQPPATGDRDVQPHAGQPQTDPNAQQPADPQPPPGAEPARPQSPPSSGSGTPSTAGPTPKLEKEIVPGSPSPNYSRAVKAGGWVYVAGVLGVSPGTRTVVSTDFAAQARMAMENMKASVEASGSTLARVVKCNVYLTNQSDFATFNQVYLKFFPESPPARSTVIVKELVMPGAKIEIDCVAIA